MPESIYWVKKDKMRLLCLTVLLALRIFSVPAQAEEARAAVAANFLTTFRVLVSGFAHKTNHQIVIISGSSGKLYACWKRKGTQSREADFPMP
jgi:ABC-type molybdate transport system substrate-binding protein